MNQAAERPIRRATSGDIATIESIAVAAKMFAAEDVGFLGDPLRDVPGGDEPGPRCLVFEDGSGVIAAVYFAPEPFADRMWNLYFIAVAPACQGRGVGRQLMLHVEQQLRAWGESVARTLVVETSSTEQYEGTRAFYDSLGYAREARIRQFYGPQDDKIVFWKSLL